MSGTRGGRFRPQDPGVTNPAGQSLLRLLGAACTSVGGQRRPFLSMVPEPYLCTQFLTLYNSSSLSLSSRLTPSQTPGRSDPLA